MAQTIETPTEVETKLFKETLELIKKPREPESNKSFFKKTPENTLSINLLKIGINHQESDLDDQEKKEKIIKKLEKLKSDNDKRVEKSKKAEEEFKKAQEELKKAEEEPIKDNYKVENCRLNLQKSLNKTLQFYDLSSAKIKYNKQIIELLNLNPDSDKLSSEYLSQKQINILRDVSSYREPKEFNRDHYFFGLAFANYAMENIDNPDELEKIQDFLKKFQKTMDIGSEILELPKRDDNEVKILQLNKLPKIQIQSVKNLYDAFQYNDGEYNFLTDSKEALHTTRIDEDPIFQNNFKNLQDKLNPKNINIKPSPSSLKFEITTLSEKIKKIKGKDLEELYSDFKENLPGGFTEFSNEIDKDFLKREYGSFFERKITDLKASLDYDEVSKFISFYKKFYSLCQRYFTSKYVSENESTGSDFSAFKSIDDNLKMEEFKNHIADKFLESLDGLSSHTKVEEIKKFTKEMSDHDVMDFCRIKLKEKLFKDLEKLSIDEETSDFFKKRKPEIEHVGIADFRKKVRTKIYETKTKQIDPTKLFTAYSQSEIDLGSQKIFRGFVEDDKAEENLRRQLRDSLTPAKNLNQKFEDFLEDNRHLFFLKTFNPVTSTILSCVDRFGNFLGSSKPNNQVALDKCGAVQNKNNLSNVGVNNRDLLK